MKTFPKGTTFDTNNLKPVEVTHMYFAFYNVTYTKGSTSVLTVVCENTRMLWLFTN